MLPQEITAIRQRHALSMSGLAKRLGVPVDLVVDWESGQRFPTKKHHAALKALGNEGDFESPQQANSGET